MWAQASQFMEVVYRGWHNLTKGDLVHQVMYHLKLLKQPLLALGKSQFPDILKQLEAARVTLIKAQEAVSGDKWNSEVINAEKEALR